VNSSKRDHLRLLSIFHYVLAGLGALFSFVPSIYIVLGVMLLSGKFDGKNPPPPFLGYILLVLGVLFMLVGFTVVVLLVLAGRFLAQARHWTFCVVVAAVSCAFFPLGTVLGVFTILTLADAEGRATFGLAKSSA